LENFLTLETEKKKKTEIHCELYKGIFGKIKTLKSPHFEEKKKKKKKLEVAYFRHLSSCKSPKLGGISKTFYWSVQPLAKFG
jgi:ribosomal protein L34E